MRHIIIRLIAGIIWLIAAVVCCQRGSYLFTILYAVLGIAFLFSGISEWKKGR